MIYLVVTFAILFLSFRFDVCGMSKGRDFCYIIMLVMFILVAGLRWRIGIDTPVYLYRYYHEVPVLSDLSFHDFSITDSPLFIVLESIIKTFSGKFFVFQLLHASIVNILIFYYFKRHSQYIFTCLFFYSWLCYTTYNMEIMRGSLSIVICLYANDYILDKKWLKGYFLFVLALFFHAQALVMFILPLFFFLRFNRWGLWACVISFLIGKIFISFFGDYIFLFEVDEGLASKISLYSNSDKYGSTGGNLVFIIFYILTPFFYIILSFLYLKQNSISRKLLILEPLFLLGACFIMIRVNLEIAYRFVDFFKIYFALLFSEFFVEMIKRTKQLSVILAYSRSWVVFIPFLFVFCVYSYMIDGKGTRYRYVPYSSVIDRSIDKNRELKYVESNANKDFYPRPNQNQY